MIVPSFVAANVSSWTVVATVDGRDVVLRALLRPLHRPAEALRQRDREKLLRVDVELRAEASSHVGRDDAYLRLRDAEDERHREAQDVRHLRRGPQRDVARRPDLREHASRLDRVRDQARLDVAPRHDDVCRVDRGLRIARLELPDVALVRLELGVDERSVVRECLLDVTDRAEGLVVDLDELRRILGQRAALGDDDGDAVTLIARLVSGERVVRRHLDVLRHRPGAGHAADPVAGEVRTGERGDDTLRSPGGVEVDAVDPRVGIRAADDRHVDRPRQCQVVDEGATSAQQGGVLLALDGRPDVGLGGSR